MMNEKSFVLKYREKLTEFVKHKSKMNDQKWLSSEENKWLEEDSVLSKDQDQLASKLNSY